jgi:hypothetical protein
MYMVNITGVVRRISERHCGNITTHVVGSSTASYKEEGAMHSRV